jgi:hypothetical protein
MNRICYSSAKRPEFLSRMTMWALGVLLLTTVHHVYGAYAFGTPWRLHVAFVSRPAALAVATSQWLLGRHRQGVIRCIAFWTLVAVTVVIAILLFGLFEGAYNHVLKNALYFGGASSELMNRLFPPPTYELPSDVFFEMTGVMQVVPAACATGSLIRLFRSDLADSVHAVGHRHEVNA